jgi:ribosomal protein S18 acetylase RimI-like enzyme
MGKIYKLKKSDFNYDEELKNQIIIKEILTNDEAEDFIRLQALASSEISEEVSILTKTALTTKSPYSFEGLIFCIAKSEGKCIGYGYGYIDDEKNTFYIDTIGVDSQHRGKKIGTEIKVKLIKHAFENPKIEYIKAITQHDNEKTVHINTKLGFNISQIPKNN